MPWEKIVRLRAKEQGGACLAWLFNVPRRKQRLRQMKTTHHNRRPLHPKKSGQNFGPRRHSFSVYAGIFTSSDAKAFLWAELVIKCQPIQDSGGQGRVRAEYCWPGRSHKRDRCWLFSYPLLRLTVKREKKLPTSKVLDGQPTRKIFHLLRSSRTVKGQVCLSQNKGPTLHSSDSPKQGFICA